VLLILAILGVSALLAYGLAWVSTPDKTGTSMFNSWASFMAALGLTALILYGSWRLVRAAEGTRSAQAGMAAPAMPGWLAWLLVGAALLRLILGVVWYTALPTLGHHTPQETAGYVMSDASKRDQVAWKLSQADKPLWQAFTSYRGADQYGGMLFVSAAVYRYLNFNQQLLHQPLLLVVITAAVSALAILFTWAFARRVWDDQVACLSAWGMALLPEVVLLGSSQMREAFIIPIVAAGFYGLARLRREHTWSSLAWVGAAVLLSLTFSPPTTALLIAALAICAFAIRRDLFPSGVRRPWWVWALAALVMVITLIGLYAALQQFAPTGTTNPIEVFSWWLRKSTYLQAYFSERASGWVQKIFDLIPAWAQTPFLLGYGVTRPFLPAALVASSEAPIWTAITLWRAVGWSILLVFLVYALLRAWLKKETDPFTKALTVVIWLGILIASLRGGGDQDDNPRYRAAFASIQVATAAWAYFEQKRSADPLFRRALAGLALVLAWMLLWYLRRRFDLPWVNADLFKTIGLGLASAALFVLWDMVRSSKMEKK
jgi:hypothetical protein